MRKMKARSLTELGRMADKLKLVPEKPATLLNRAYQPFRAFLDQRARACRAGGPAARLRRILTFCLIS